MEITNRCVCCGEEIPEGQQVCNNCIGDETVLKGFKEHQYLKYKNFKLSPEIARYAYNDGLAIKLWHMGLPYATLTVNLSDFPSNYPCAFVDTNNFPDALKFIEINKIGKPTGRIGYSGFCEYPEVRFDIKELKKYEV